MLRRLPISAGRQEPFDYMILSDQEPAVSAAVGHAEKLRRWYAFDEKRLALAQVLAMPVVKEALELVAARIVDEPLTVPAGSDGKTTLVLMANQHSRSAGWNHALTYFQKLARLPDKRAAQHQEPQPWSHLIPPVTETTEQDA